MNESETLVGKKMIELRDGLAAWAEANRVLGAGQRLVFTLRIENTPTVVCEGSTTTTTDITPQQVYDATLRVKQRHKSVSSLKVSTELGCGSALAMRIYKRGSWFRAAYFAAQEGKPFPENPAKA